MEKFKLINKIKEIYSKGENIMDFLKRISDNEKNSIEDILISYEFQTGTYIKGYYKNKDYFFNYSKAFSKILNSLCNYNSILEVGVGEATTLCSVLNRLEKKPEKVMGFDISWSRVKFGSEFLKKNNHSNVNMFVANLFEIPLPDNSVDIVYTSHSIEPNGGKEKEALQELYRITKKYLVLLEPSYEFATEEARKRMIRLGYVTRLYETAKELNYKIIEHRLFDYYINPLNPTGLMIIEKLSNEEKEISYVCPISYSKLIKYNNCFYYSPESCLAYPILDEIPCLLKENAILAIHLNTDIEKFISTIEEKS